LKRFDVLVVGDANIDLVVEECPGLPVPGQEIRVKNMITNVGGGAALCAMGLSKLGLRTSFYGVLGSDLYGNFIRNQFRELNIETSYLKTSKNNNTGISISIFGESDRAFITYDGSNLEFDISSVDLEVVNQARHIHITGYKGLKNHDKYVSFIKNVKKKGVTISTDVGWDETGEWYNGIFELISDVDVFFTNEVEALNYTKSKSIEDALIILGKHCNNVVVKMGEKGSAAKLQDEILYEPAHKVKVVDTTGAGDSFNAGYLYGFLKNETLKNCLRYGNGCGALSVTKSGGNTGFPNLESLLRLIKGN
jgi:sugar/nucleoside kinase (ribokinase family)